MAQFEASVPAKEQDPTMMRRMKSEHAPEKWIVRRPNFCMRNQEPAVPMRPRASEIMDMLKDWTVGRPAFCMK